MSHILCILSRHKYIRLVIYQRATLIISHAHLLCHWPAHLSTRGHPLSGYFCLPAALALWNAHRPALCSFPFLACFSPPPYPLTLWFAQSTRTHIPCKLFLPRLKNCKTKLVKNFTQRVSIKKESDWIHWQFITDFCHSSIPNLLSIYSK